MEPVKKFTIHIGEDQICLDCDPKSLPQGKIVSDRKIQEVFNQVLASSDLYFLKNENVTFTWNGFKVEDWDINTSSGVMHAHLKDFSLEKLNALKNSAKQKTFLKVAIAALSILALIGTHKKFGTLNPMNIYKQVFPRNIPQ